MSSLVTKRYSSNSIGLVPCKQCDAKIGQRCRSTSGTTLRMPHIARVKAMKIKIDHEARARFRGLA